MDDPVALVGFDIVFTFGPNIPEFLFLDQGREPYQATAFIPAKERKGHLRGIVRAYAGSIDH